MERSYTKAPLGENGWSTVVVARKVKQAVSEMGANARMSQAIKSTPESAILHALEYEGRRIEKR